MKVNCSKGVTVDVNVAKLPGDIADANTPIGHAVYIGLRNILMDAHASVTAETHPKTDDRTAAARAVVEKKLTALMAGEVRVAGTRATDPIEAEMRVQAQKTVDETLRAGGLKPHKVDKKLRAKAIADYLQWNADELRAAAEKVIAARKTAKPAAKLPDSVAKLLKLKG